MKYLDYEIILLTPAFISGADQREAELRSATVKGVLRWWWRAVSAAMFPDTRKLLKEEGLIFGSADLKMKSRIGVTIHAQQLRVVGRGGQPFRCGIKVGQGQQQIDSLEYLAYGPVATVGRKERDESGKAFDPAFNDSSGRARRGLLLKRPAIEAGQTFKVRISLMKDALSAKQEEQLLKAISAWILLGGVGSRSRKGWGALELGNIAGKPKELVESARRITAEQRKALFSTATAQPTTSQSLPRWPDLTCRVLLHSCTANTWQEALGNLGVRYKHIRSGTTRSRRWICGQADQRRSSSVFLTVKKEAHKYYGHIIALLCEKGLQGASAADWKDFLAKAGRAAPGR